MNDVIPVKYQEQLAGFEMEQLLSVNGVGSLYHSFVSYEVNRRC